MLLGDERLSRITETIIGCSYKVGAVLGSLREKIEWFWGGQKTQAGRGNNSWRFKIKI